jgi:hypothetical protein
LPNSALCILTFSIPPIARRLRPREPTVPAFVVDHKLIEESGLKLPATGVLERVI